MMMNDEKNPTTGQNPAAGMPLFAVDPAVVDAVLALPVPAHPSTTFDEALFKDLLARSYSLTLEEKKDILTSVPKFSQKQVDELQRILLEEREKFAELNAKHLAKLKELEAKHATQWAALEAKAKQLDEEAHKKEEDERKAAAIRAALEGGGEA